MNTENKKENAKAVISAANITGIFDVYYIINNFLIPQFIILMYHRVNIYKDQWSIDVTNPLDFERQMRHILKTCRIVSLDEIVQNILEKNVLPKRLASVTFDDGYKDIHTFAFPILKELEIPATVFLTTGHIGTNNLLWWDKIRYILLNTNKTTIRLDELGEISLPLYSKRPQMLHQIIERFKEISDGKKNDIIKELIDISDVEIPKNMGKDIMLSWDEVKEMSENGINFGSHTVTHPILTKLPPKRAKYEIIQSKKEIQKRLDKPISSFCYPNGTPGDFNEDLKKTLKENGYTCAVTRIPRTNTLKTDLFELGRLLPGGSYSEFKFCISGLYSATNNVLSQMRK